MAFRGERVLAVFADTHGTADPRLAGRASDALADADAVVHAGDFTTEAVYAAFDRHTPALTAVHGNSDEPSLQNRLPAVDTLEWQGYRLVVVHGHDHSPTALSLLARERAADLVVLGHMHRPAVERLGDCPVVNPGSHADPRVGPPSHAELRAGEGEVRIEIRDRSGDVLEAGRISGTD